MSVRTKLIKFLECPDTVIAKFRGIRPDHAYYLSSIKNVTDKKFKTIIDVGASNGLYSEASHYYYPEAQIYAFEPVPKKIDRLSNFKWLKLWNVDKNSLIFRQM